MTGKIIAYTNREKVLLANLVSHHKIIEDKRTDAATIQMKQAEWIKISASYNAQTDIVSTQRSDTQLKKLWNNLKQRKRKETTEAKYNLLKTGGGPPPEEKMDPIMEAVSVAAPHMDVNLECPWESTAIYVHSCSPSQQPQQQPASTCTAGPYISENEDGGGDTIALSSVSPLPPVDPPLLTPSTPAAPILPASNSRVRRRADLETESSLRIKKMKESIEQQRHLYTIRLKIEEETLLKVAAERRKADLEEELARKILESHVNIK